MRSVRRLIYAMLQKIYGGVSETPETRYSPAVCMGARKAIISGNPDHSHVSTSYAERQNLTMRMSMRRFTRLTNEFSKKLENHAHALARYFMYSGIALWVSGLPTLLCSIVFVMGLVGLVLAWVTRF